MRDHESALQKAMVAALKADPALSALVQGRVFDQPGPDAACPYLTLGRCESHSPRDRMVAVPPLASGSAQRAYDVLEPHEQCVPCMLEVGLGPAVASRDEGRMDASHGCLR